MISPPSVAQTVSISHLGYLFCLWLKHLADDYPTATLPHTVNQVEGALTQTRTWKLGSSCSLTMQCTMLPPTSTGTSRADIRTQDWIHTVVKTGMSVLTRTQALCPTGTQHFSIEPIGNKRMLATSCTPKRNSESCWSAGQRLRTGQLHARNSSDIIRARPKHKMDCLTMVPSAGLLFTFACTSFGCAFQRWMVSTGGGRDSSARR